MNRLVALLELDVPLIAQLWVDGATPEDVRKAVECGMDIAELRFDRFATLSAEHIERQLERFPDVAKIATLRSAAEGGGWRGSDADRTKLFERVAPRVDGIDIELSSGHAVTAVRDLCRMNDCLMIVSYHNYESTPASDDLRDIVMRSKDCGADIVKIATWAGDSEAAGRLANLLVTTEEDVVVIGLGPSAMYTRIFFPILGSRVTFASGLKSSEPGQLSLEQTMEFLRMFCADYDKRRGGSDRLVT